MNNRKKAILLQSDRSYTDKHVQRMTTATTNSTTTNISLQLALLILGIVLIWVGVSYILVRCRDYHRMQFNSYDWHIDFKIFSVPILPIRCCDTVGCGCGPSCSSGLSLFVVETVWIRPALQRSLKVLHDAEESGYVASILCDEQARSDLERRVMHAVQHLKRSPTLTVTAKISFAYQIGICLQRHSELLKFGTSRGVASQTVESPIFIVRFPRTSTTLLHRTMALDTGRFRSFDLCDMVSGPCALASSPTYTSLRPKHAVVPRDDATSRQLLAKRTQKWMDQYFNFLFPNYLAAMDRMGYDGYRPDEPGDDFRWYNSAIGFPYMDLLLLLHDRLAQETEGHPWRTRHLASYRYAWLDMIMRIYQQTDDEYAAAAAAACKSNVDVVKRRHQQRTGSKSQDIDVSETTTLMDDDNPDIGRNVKYRDRRPWLMKDMDHASFLPELVKQFPDAKFVFTHRNPADVVASMAKVTVCYASVYHNIGRPGTTSREWGQEANERLCNYCDGIVAFTNNSTDEAASRRRIDFQYLDLACSIPQCIEKIYMKFFPDNPNVSPTAAAAFEKYLKENESRANHHYEQRRNMVEFGLKIHQVERQYAEYTDMFVTDCRDSRRRVVEFSESTDKV